MAKEFPCPVCKGKGRFIEDYVDWYEISYACYYCNGAAFIEIDGPLHKRQKRAKILHACINYVGSGYSISEDFLEAQIDNLIKFLDSEKTTYPGEGF